MSFGWRFETTARAAIFSPFAVTTPAARPFSTRISLTAAPVRISTPRAAQARAIACVIAPMPPIAWPQTPFLPFTSPKAMVQQHIGRARGIGAGVGSDDAVEAEDRLDRIALEPLVEEVARRAGEDLDAIALPLEAERAQAVCDLGRVEERGQIGDETLTRRQVRGRLEGERAQDVGHPLEPRLVGVEPLGVAGGELGDFRPRAPRRDLQITPVGQRQEVR